VRGPRRCCWLHQSSGSWGSRRFEGSHCLYLQGQAVQDEDNTFLQIVWKHSPSARASNPRGLESVLLPQFPSVSRSGREPGDKHSRSSSQFPLLPVEKLKRNGICDTHNHVMSIFLTSLLKLSVCRTSRVMKPPLFCKNMSPFTNCTSHVSDN